MKVAGGFGMLGALLGSTIAACDDTTKFTSVPVEGLPSCSQAAGLNGLKRPLLLEVDHGNGTLRQPVLGMDKLLEARLPQRKGEFTVRVGHCQHPSTPPTSPALHPYECGRPQWIGSPQSVTVDTRAPGAKLVVPSPPGNHPCWR